MQRIWTWLCLICLAIPVKLALPPSFRHILPVVNNKITDISVTCDATSFNITLSLEHPFKGLLFAKDFAQECKTLGDFKSKISIELPTSGCGVRLSSDPGSGGDEAASAAGEGEGEEDARMRYSVALVLQQDRHLRQAADREKRIECAVPEEAFAIRSDPVAAALRTDLKKAYSNHRTGRTRFDGWSQEAVGAGAQERALDEALAAARAWLEVRPERAPGRAGGGSDSLRVGEPALLTVKSTLPAGIGWRVVECFAHDGLGEASQRLLDGRGCPLDERLLPAPLPEPARPIALMRHQSAVSRFSAFKFPDRARLHLACALLLCRAACPQVDCHAGNDTTDNRLGRMSTKGQQGEILDKLEVFNSVEVVAPEIDDVTGSEGYQADEERMYPFSRIPGDRAFCVSADTMALAFCVLGIVFLGAVVAAAASLLRARRRRAAGPRYQRSLLSSSTSSGSAYPASRLLHTRASPCVSQATSRGPHYGRIL